MSTDAIEVCGEGDPSGVSTSQGHVQLTVFSRQVSALAEFSTLEDASYETCPYRAVPTNTA
jgi:hypothetical protein